jgi:multisubunit Na+/H+ antiporter MnhC subunit
MNRNPSGPHRRLTLDRYLAEILLLGGLAELIPLKQRGRFATHLALAILILSLMGWIGLPWRLVVLCLLLAFTTEALDYYWQRRGSGYSALVRRSLWARIRPSFYWSLAGSVLLGTWLYAGSTLAGGLLRAGFQWLCFRTIEDLANHPERYGSTEHFSNWLRHLRQQHVRAFQAWVKYAIVGALLAVVLNLSSAQIWASVGHTAWNRLFVFGGGLYLFALLTYRGLSRSAVRSSVNDVMERWEGVRPSELKRTLRSVPAVPGLFYAGARSAELVEERLQWKNEDNLVARVGQQLIATLVRRYQWNVSVSSALILVLVALLISTSAFLIIPRDVIARWITFDIVEGSGPALAIDSFADLGGEGFWRSLLELDGPGLAAEPLPKLAFLEAIVIVSLIMFETSASQIKADLNTSEVRRWLTLGTTYLALLESDFQYLCSGFITRRLAAAGVLRFVSIRNDVLLVPSAQRRLDVFKGVSDFLRIYGFPDWGAYPSAIAVFDNYALAQEWIGRFLRFSPLLMGRPHDFDRGIDQELGTVSGRYWIWSGNRLLALSNLDEARWYARLVALYNHPNGARDYEPY